MASDHSIFWLRPVTVPWLIGLRREGQNVSAWSFLKVGVIVMPGALILAVLGPAVLIELAASTNPSHFPFPALPDVLSLACHAVFCRSGHQSFSRARAIRGNHSTLASMAADACLYQRSGGNRGRARHRRLQHAPRGWLGPHCSSYRSVPRQLAHGPSRFSRGACVGSVAAACASARVHCLGLLGVRFESRKSETSRHRCAPALNRRSYGWGVSIVPCRRGSRLRRIRRHPKVRVPFSCAGASSVPLRLVPAAASWLARALT